MQMVVYPNPAHDVVNVAVKGVEGTCVLRVIDLTGRAVIRQNISNGGDFRQVRLSVSGLSKGSYYVILTDKKGNNCTETLVLQ